VTKADSAVPADAWDVISRARKLSQAGSR